MTDSTREQTCPDVLILSHDAPDYLEQLRDLSQAGTRFHLATCVEEMTDASRQVSIVLGEPSLIAIAAPQVPDMQWVQSTWAGVTPLLSLARQGVLVTGVKDVFGQQMAEYTLAYLLSHELDLAGRQRAQRREEWDDRPTGTLAGKTLGVMGTGSIGAEIAQRAAPFGLRLIGFSRSGSAVAPFERVYAAAELDAFLARLDYLVTVLPHTPETDHLLDAVHLASLPSHAFLINVGRGNLIDADALVACLRGGHLAGAVLDVFEEEPLPPGHPYWQTPRLELTAHVAARSWPRDIAAIFKANYENFSAGAALNYALDPHKGY